jgi:hypothetical protein
MGYGTDTLTQLAPNAPAPVTYMQVYQAMWKRHFPDGYGDQQRFWHRVYHDLTPGERALLLANELFGEFHNGGFDQYFANGNYAHAHEAARLLRLVGNHRAADFLQRAIEAAGIPDPLPAGYEYEYSDEVTEALENLEKEARPSRPFSNFEEPLAAYIRQHPEEFV